MSFNLKVVPSTPDGYQILVALQKVCEAQMEIDRMTISGSNLKTVQVICSDLMDIVWDSLQKAAMLDAETEKTK